MPTFHVYMCIVTENDHNNLWMDLNVISILICLIGSKRKFELGKFHNIDYVEEIQQCAKFVNTHDTRKLITLNVSGRINTLSWTHKLYWQLLMTKNITLSWLTREKYLINT